MVLKVALPVASSGTVPKLVPVSVLRKVTVPVGIGGSQSLVKNTVADSCTVCPATGEAGDMVTETPVDSGTMVSGTDKGKQEPV